MTDNLTIIHTDAFLPLRVVVFHTLRDAILRGDLEPGERLMELHLANKLGVSRTPVREAIHMLEHEGLVVMAPRRGAQVAEMTEKDLQDVLEVRDALDALAISAAARNMTEEKITALQQAMERFERAVRQGKTREIAEADEDFHNVIYEAAGNPRLSAIVQNLKEQMYRYRFGYIKDIADYQKLTEEHRNILEGLRRQDTDYAREAMHEHLKNQVNGVRAIIRDRKRLEEEA